MEDPGHDMGLESASERASERESGSQRSTRREPRMSWQTKTWRACEARIQARSPGQARVDLRLVTREREQDEFESKSSEQSKKRLI